MADRAVHSSFYYSATRRSQVEIVRARLNNVHMNLKRRNLSTFKSSTSFAEMCRLSMIRAELKFWSYSATVCGQLSCMPRSGSILFRFDMYGNLKKSKIVWARCNLDVKSTKGSCARCWIYRYIPHYWVSLCPLGGKEWQKMGE